LTLFGLLPNEHKMSVLNFTCQRPLTAEDDAQSAPIKSKDELLICCGFRRYYNRPIYSQDTRSQLHKYERFLQNGRINIGTIYGPIMFPPSPVFMFRDPESTDASENAPMAMESNAPAGATVDQLGLPTMVSSGSLVSVNPSHVVVKRIILTGHPFKIHKRGAVIRFMFFTPEDVMWFRPVELRTKLGRTGHIRESLGTHGYMKCLFDGPLKAQDTVCMYLYKRMFPKWPKEVYACQNDPWNKEPTKPIE
jgi:pre-rRNA-processing protein TSR1